MSIIQGNALENNVGSVIVSEYDIPYSLRFRKDASAYLSKTLPVVSSKNKWTWSGWVKRGSLGVVQQLFSAGLVSGTYYYTNLRFDTDNTLVLQNYNEANSCYLKTAQVFRDTAAHYHICVVWDTTNPTASERAQLYVNGKRISTFNAGAFAVTYPALNTDSMINTSAYDMHIGAFVNGSIIEYFDGYMSDVHFIDNQSLNANSFGYISAETGQWHPKTYTGTYGTNGFYLDFKSGTTLGSLCSDKSGNGNNWTPHNISLSSGVSYDWMLDTPTNNYCTLDGNTKITSSSYYNGTLTNGGLTAIGEVSLAHSNALFATTIIPQSGKYYFEATNVVAVPAGLQGGYGGYPYLHVGSSYMYCTPDSGVPQGTVVGIAVDITNKLYWYSLNGVWTGNPSTGTNGIPYTDNIPYTFIRIAIAGYAGTLWQMSVNFGQQPFSHPTPIGFNTLCTKNLPTPAITNPKQYFDTKTYLGNGASLQIGETQKSIDLVSIDHSLRFRGATQLNATLSGDRTKWTWSGWVKRTSFGTNQCIIHGYHTNSYYTSVNFITDDTISFGYATGASGGVFTTLRKFKRTDWMHIVIVWDTTNATANHRVRLFVNGVEETEFSVDNRASLLNYQSGWNNGVYTNRIGAGEGALDQVPTGTPVNYFNGYMADINVIDGQALTASDFGQWDANGYWVPKHYTGTYGATGAKIDFRNNASIAELGYDQSGNNKNYTVTGASITTGIDNDWMIDTPTNNFAIIDPFSSSNTTYLGTENGALGANCGTGVVTWAMVTLSVAGGKYYFECIPTYTSGDSNNGLCVGVTYGTTSYNDINEKGITYGSYNGYARILNINSTPYGAAWNVGDVVGVAVDAINGIVTFYKNGVSQGDINVPGIVGKPSLRPFIFNNSSTARTYAYLNFGQRPFSHTKPTGYLSLSENNIIESIGDVETPDLAWIKSRSLATDHMWFDSVRGTGKSLSSNTAGLEFTDNNSLIQFNKNGFYIGQNTNINTLNASYVAWLWKANGPAVLNTMGTIQSQVSANPVNGVSIVTGTLGAGTGQTFGHGLGINPKLLIAKFTSGITSDWVVYHDSLGASKYMLLDSADSQYIATTAWNGVAPSASVVTLGAWGNSANSKFVAYCFAEIDGFSKFGTYNGTGTTDGAFINLGFTPAFVMVKCVTAGGGDFDWQIFDATRDPYNMVSKDVDANRSDVEGAANVYNIDFVSNGIKFRNTYGSCNGPYTYIYAAFAEAPTKFAHAR